MVGLQLQSENPVLQASQSSPSVSFLKRQTLRLKGQQRGHIPGQKNNGQMKEKGHIPPRLKGQLEG